MSVGPERNGAEPAGDWIVTDAVKGVSGASVRATSRFSAKKVNADEETIASNDGWADQ